MLLKLILVACILETIIMSCNGFVRLYMSMHPNGTYLAENQSRILIICTAKSPNKFDDVEVALYKNNASVCFFK